MGRGKQNSTLLHESTGLIPNLSSRIIVGAICTSAMPFNRGGEMKRKDKGVNQALAQLAALLLGWGKGE